MTSAASRSASRVSQEGTMRWLSCRLAAICGLAVIPLGVIGLAPAPTVAAQASPSVDEPYDPAIDPANFVAEIDNPYWPLIPGTTYVYEGTIDGEAERSEVVTSETKTILGVACVVVLDRVYVEGELHEETYDWYAQDKDGNVWYFGEASTDYEDGEAVSTGGSWESGVDGAKPGIVMKAQPRVGDVYRQEYYPDEAEDMAEVLEIGGGLVTVPYGTFDDVLVTKEWSPLEPEVVEHKTYAPGIGLIREEVIEGGEGGLELVDIITADGATPAASPTT
jgi:hypothetical protein